MLHLGLYILVYNRPTIAAPGHLIKLGRFTPINLVDWPGTTRLPAAIVIIKLLTPTSSTFGAWAHSL